MPRRFGASGSVRASSRHQSACRAPLAHSFWPLTTNRRPPGGPSSAGWRGRTRPRARRTPGTRSRRRGSPAGGAAAARRCPPRAASRPRGGSRRRRARGGARRGPRAPGRARPAAAADMPPPHSAGQWGTAYPAPRSCWNQSCWKATKTVLGHAGLGLAPPGGHVRPAPRPDLGPEVVQVGHEKSPLRPRRPRRLGEGGAGGRRAERQPPEGLAAGTATTARSRRRTRWRRAAGG